ncbi:MAG TPA: hypothetical protein VGO24_08245 [Solirubrobacterales bacterium]|jgi:hypothetical protein|nr:hypothetical protein [Solirubrobacterales bacterium]
MTDVNQPRTARRTLLPAGILATALFALLALAPLASATPDPVASGCTTVTLENSFTKYLKTFGITVSKVSPAKLKGNKVTFTVTGGSLDPTTGLGTVNLGGGLKFKAGKKSAPVKGLVLDTSKKALTGKVAGKKVKFGSLAGWSFARNGFGVNLTVKKLKLTNAAATALNKKLGYAKGKPKPFLGNKLIAKASAETQPSTVAVLPGGNVTFTGTASTLAKLVKVGVKIETIAPTASPALGLYNFPISGGTVSPAGTGGVVQSAGGLKLVQKLQTGPTTFLTTNITLGAFYVDLAAKTATVEVVAESNASKELNLGNLGRSSIADLTVGGVVANPATRTVTISAGSALQVISAKVLNGFVEVYEGYEKAGGPKVSPEKLNPGESLGTFAFTAVTQ